MIIRKYIFLIFLIGFIACEDEDITNQEDQSMDELLCESEEEYFAVMTVNDTCWITDSISLLELEDKILFDIYFNSGKGFEEELILTIPDTLKTKTKYCFRASEGDILLAILEGFDAIISGFEPKTIESDCDNWIEFDTIDEELGEYEAIFEAVLIQQRQQTIYPTSDTLVMKNGHIRIVRE